MNIDEITTQTYVNLRNDFEFGERVSDDPCIYLFDGFMNDLEIGEIISLAEARFERALVSSSKGGYASPGRSGRNAWLGHKETPVMEELSSRLSSLVGIPLENAESFQALKYAENEEYKPHFDAWDINTERGQRCISRGGQRLITCLLYLNDVPAGGGTIFPKLNLEISAKKGRLVVFHNCMAESNIRNPLSLHGGMSVLKGDKWACNLWFREEKFK